MKLPVTGGCACGAIRYEASAEPLGMLNCHCRDCQHITGSAFVSAVVFPADAFGFTRGTPRYHETTAASGNRHKRGFCPDCGSRLTGGENPEGTSGIVGVTLGSLDDPALFQAQMDIWTSRAQPWTRMDPAIPKLDRIEISSTSKGEML